MDYHPSLPYFCNMSKIILSTVLTFMLLISVKAQCPPEIERIVTEVQSQLDQTSAYEVNFSLEQSFVGETANQQKGTLLVNGNRFRLELTDQTFVSDGASLWIVIPDAKEVQIMSLDEETGLGSLSPIDILNQYCQDEFLSRSLGMANEDGREVEQLEFTPVDKEEDIFKIRISYDRERKEIYRVKTFSKDGSRMTLTASEYNFTPSFTKSYFQYNVTDHPDYNVEDLR